MRFLLVSEKAWHKKLFAELETNTAHQWQLVTSKTTFTLEEIEAFQPDKIFIPHWSYIIPESIFRPYECIVFHMTDLPFGRGGSPLQNLIARGIKETMISAIRVEEGLDTGAVYLKQPLSLYGTAEEIFIRSAGVVKEMILEIIEKNLEPVPQQGEPVVFTRRKPHESNIAQLDSLEQVYDYIRMLDAEGYPKAFVEVGNLRFEFSRAAVKNDQSLLADVRITQK